jgi:hypothetical protein
MFEKLGWMTLAARDGNKDSIRGYIAGIKHLIEKIKLKHKETKDIDRKNDLKELLDDVVYLHEVGKHLLNTMPQSLQSVNKRK